MKDWYPKSPSVKKHEICSDPISAEPICPFPSLISLFDAFHLIPIIIIIIIIIISLSLKHVLLLLLSLLLLVSPFGAHLSPSDSQPAANVERLLLPGPEPGRSHSNDNDTLLYSSGNNNNANNNSNINNTNTHNIHNIINNTNTLLNDANNDNNNATNHINNATTNNTTNHDNHNDTNTTNNSYVCSSAEELFFRLLLPGPEPGRSEQ